MTGYLPLGGGRERSSWVVDESNGEQFLSSDWKEKLDKVFGEILKRDFVDVRR